MKKNKRYLVLLLGASLLLTACGRSDITASSPDFWEKFVYFFAESIRFLSFNGSTGIGIILFTLLIRTILLPVFHFQMVATRKTQEIQPKIKELQAKYPGRDMDSRARLAEETQALFKENGVNQWAPMIPLLIQMPVLLALYQALTRVDFLRTGHFLWLNLAQPDPTFILPILAAVFTFLSSWLSTKALSEKNGVSSTMTYFMPVLIFFFSVSVASGVALYWAVSNAYQVGQTLLLQNPFKIIAEREAKAAAEKEKADKQKRAYRKAQKRKSK